MLHLGCAVWAFREWVGTFYPPGTLPKDFLKLYGERLTAVEGNTTFYSIPSAATVDRWCAQTPETFQFCPKIPRQYSHRGPLLPHLPATLTFWETLRRLGPRLGPVMLQLPPSYGPDLLPDLLQFLTRWPRQEAPISVEVRHLDWFRSPWESQLNDGLEALGVGRILLDTRPMYDGVEAGLTDPQFASERRKPRVPLHPAVTAPFALVRYIGHPDLNFNEPYRLDWVPRIQGWLRAGTAVYLFIHCPDEARSPAIARHFYGSLQAVAPTLPSLPWDGVVASGDQLSLF